MTRIAEDVRAKSRGEMAIVTLPDLAGRDVADVALAIGREWKVGKVGTPGDPTRNAGAVILLVPKETNSDNRGRCFVLTGQGTEGFITDATAGDICREATPFFMQRDYASGLELVTLRTAQRFAGEFNFTSIQRLPRAPVVQRRAERSDGGISPVVFFIIFFVVVSLLNRASGAAERVDAVDVAEVCRSSSRWEEAAAADGAAAGAALGAAVGSAASEAEAVFPAVGAVLHGETQRHRGLRYAEPQRYAERCQLAAVS